MGAHRSRRFLGMSGCCWEAIYGQSAAQLSMETNIEKLFAGRAPGDMPTPEEFHDAMDADASARLSEERSMFDRWLYHDAEWWQFWWPNSGMIGGALLGLVCMTILIAVSLAMS